MWGCVSPPTVFGTFSSSSKTVGSDLSAILNLLFVFCSCRCSWEHQLVASKFGTARESNNNWTVEPNTERLTNFNLFESSNTAIWDNVLLSSVAMPFFRFSTKPLPGHCLSILSIASKKLAYFDSCVCLSKTWQQIIVSTLFISVSAAAICLGLPLLISLVFSETSSTLQTQRPLLIRF